MCRIFGYGVVVVAWVVLAWSVGGAPVAAPDPHAARVALGERLFADPRLAADRSMRCRSCHQPERLFTDGVAVPENGRWNTPSIVDLATRTRFGWASPAATTLLDAIRAPLANPVELASWGRADVIARIAADPELAAAYQAAFPGVAAPVQWETTAQALAAYVATLTAPTTPYDAWLAGDATALSAAAQRGERLFRELGCRMCHAGPKLRSDSYHTIGLDAPGTGDPGVAEATGRAEDWGKVRVPSLRGLRLTAPYFHDGRTATLEEVVRIYRDGGTETGRTNPLRSGGVGAFPMTDQELHDLVAFLESL